MSRNHQLYLTIAIVAMAATGWNLGGASSRETTAVPPPANTRSARPERAMKILPGPTGEAAQRLEAIRAATNTAERTRATIGLANILPRSEFAAWLDGAWFSPHAGMEFTVFTEILMERWRQEDPEGLLLWCRKSDSDAANPILSAWAETQPQRLLDFFKGHPDDVTELYVLDEIARKHPELALRRLQEMSADRISTNAGSPVFDVLEELAEQSPAALESVIDTLPGSFRPDAEIYLLRQKMQDSFAVELRKLWERPDGLTVLGNVLGSSDELVGKLLGELANLPASWRAGIASDWSSLFSSEHAAKWAAADLEGAGFTVEQAVEIRGGLISHIIYGDPEAALKLVTEMDLPPDQSERMLTSLFDHLKYMPEKAETLLAMLDSEEERQIARNALKIPPPSVKHPPPSELIAEIKPINEPSEWLATVTALDLGERAPNDYLGMMSEWEPEKIAALAAGFHSLPDNKKRDLSQYIVENTTYDENFPMRSEALAYFVAHPAELKTSADPGLRTIALASNHAAKIGTETPESAGEWIQSLPDGDAKLWAAKNLQSVWTIYDPEAAERWMNTLPAATRENVRSLAKSRKE